MKVLVVFVIALAIGVFTGIWYEKQHMVAPVPAPGGANHIRLVVEGNTKVDLHPSPGDIISWEDVNDNPVNVTVSKYAGQPELCQKGTPASECIVTASSGIYPYTCSTCFDPGISPGKGPGPVMGEGVKIKADTTVGIHAETSKVPVNAQVYCDPTTQMAKSQTDPLQLTTSNIVEWITGDGTSGTVTLPSGSCMNQPANNQYRINIDACTVVSTLPQTATSYPIALTGCGAGSGMIQQVSESPKQ